MTSCATSSSREGERPRARLPSTPCCFSLCLSGRVLEGESSSVGAGDLSVSETVDQDLERLGNRAACVVSAGVSSLSVEVAGGPACDGVLAVERSGLPRADVTGIGASVGGRGMWIVVEASWEAGVQ